MVFPTLGCDRAHVGTHFWRVLALPFYIIPRTGEELIHPQAAAPVWREADQGLSCSFSDLDSDHRTSVLDCCELHYPGCARLEIGRAVLQASGQK